MVRKRSKAFFVAVEQPQQKAENGFLSLIIRTEIDKFLFETCKQIRDLLSKSLNFDFRLPLYLSRKQRKEIQKWL